MTTPGCPDCGAALTGAAACASCDLPLVGPAASRLWQVDQRLTRLDEEQQALQAERAALLSQLRTGEMPYFAGTPGSPPPASAAPPAEIFAFERPAAAAPVKEANPAQVQNTLLGLGAVLLAVAGIVFASVTYRQLGVVGRATVLLLLTAAATAAPFALVRRRLTSSAEAIGAVALTLALVDAWSLRKAGLGDGMDGRTYGAIATAVLALAAGAAASALPLKVWRISAVLLAQLPVLYLLARTEADSATIGVVLAVLAAVDLAVLLAPALPKAVSMTAAAAGVIALGSAVLVSIDALQGSDRAGSLGLTCAALVLIAGATRAPQAELRAVLSGLAVPLLAGAAWGAAGRELAEAQRPLILLAVALLTLQGAGLLPRAHRWGPAFGAIAVVGAALVTQVLDLALAFGGPFSWMTDPWDLRTGSARSAVSTTEPWSGSVITLVVLAASAACVLAFGLLLDHWDKVLPPAALLLVLSALVLPLGLDTGYGVALGLLLVIGGAGCGFGVLLGGQWRVPLLAAGFTTALLAAVWSLANETATLVVVPIVAVLAIALALLEPPLLAIGALLLGGELAAVGVSAGLAEERVGGLLLLAPAICVAVSYVLRAAYRVALEVAAAVLAMAAIALTTNDADWLTMGLAVAGLIALGVAVRPDRRPVGVLAALLLASSSWVRLADANVEAPEPYVIPLAIVALGLGWERRRREPSMGSFTAYGPGLTLGVMPTLLKSFADQTPTRGLLLLVACVAGLLIGGQLRLRAPLVIFGSVLVLDALRLLGPYAQSLPRWVLPALAGLLITGVGATYEARRRDLARLKERYESLE
jgi:hypothetical protein